MRKFIKAITLLPMWPLIWVAESHGSCGCFSHEHVEGEESGCQRRARKMREWYER